MTTAAVAALCLGKTRDRNSWRREREVAKRREVKYQSSEPKIILPPLSLHLLLTSSMYACVLYYCFDFPCMCVRGASINFPPPFKQVFVLLEDRCSFEAAPLCNVRGLLQRFAASTDWQSCHLFARKQPGITWEKWKGTFLYDAFL